MYRLYGFWTWTDDSATPPFSTVQGSDPQIVMRASFDGGNNYGNARLRSMGKIGEYKTAITWNGLGTGSDLVIEAWGTDPVKVALTGANIEVEVLDSPGRGVAAKDGPPVMMRFSPDGGNTYGNERQRSLGKIGEYSAVVAWNGVGTGVDGVFEVWGTAAVKVALLGATLEVEELDS